MSLQPKDLATFEALPDGNLEVTIDRFGRLKVKFNNSPMTMEIYVIRDTERNFRCYVTTGAEGEEREVARVVKANGGEKPGHTHVLCHDGTLTVLPKTDSKKARTEATGHKAAEADAESGEGEPAPEAEPEGGKSEATVEQTPETQPAPEAPQI